MQSATPSFKSRATMRHFVGMFRLLTAFLLLNPAMSSRSRRLVDDFCQHYNNCVLKPYTKSCSCDRRTCHQFDKCCRVLPPEDEVKLGDGSSSSNRVTYSCVSPNQMPFIGSNIHRFFMVTRCPDDSDVHISAMCQMHAEGKNATFYQLPVTGRDSRIVYGNYYCALCNGERVIEYWRAARQCHRYQLVPEFEEPEPIEATSDGEVRLMEFKPVTHRVQFEDCRLSFEPTRFSDLHLCGIDSCPSQWNDTETAAKCRSPDSTLFVHTGHSPPITYRNIHCALCNGLSVDSLLCDARLMSGLYPPNLPLSVLIDFNDQSHQTSYGVYVRGEQPFRCPAGQFWDPFRMMCVRKFCHPGLSAAAADDEECQTLRIGENSLVRSRGKPNDSSLSTALNCSVLTAYNATEYILHDNNSITIVSRPDAVYLAGEYFIDGSAAHVCSPFEHSNHATLPHDEVQKLLTLIGVTLSLALLLTLLVAYSCFPSLRNTPGKCLMSLVTSLFVGELLLMFAVKWHNGSHVICIGQSVVMHYSWLAAFMWMNVLSFDVYRTFRDSSAAGAASSFASSTHSCSPGRFVKYSLYAWTLPALLVSASLSFDLLGDQRSQYRPMYASYHDNGQLQVCWFNSRHGLLVFFAAPVALLLTSNVMLFTATAVQIYRTTAASRPAVRGSNHGQQLVSETR